MRKVDPTEALRDTEKDKERNLFRVELNALWLHLGTLVIGIGRSVRLRDDPLVEGFRAT
jgi:hypothetical protein